MSYTLRLIQQLSGNGTTRTITRTCTGSGNPRVSEAIPDDSTNLSVTIAIDKSAMSLLWISSNYALTLTPYDASDQTAGDPITIGADNAYTWHSSNGAENPFSADVAYFKVTNASGYEAALVIEALEDATPA